ncbi:hypothetical protein ANTRET_LOCUS264 [Anthophora retusa]
MSYSLELHQIFCWLILLLCSQFSQQQRSENQCAKLVQRVERCGTIFANTLVQERILIREQRTKVLVENVMESNRWSMAS